MPDCYEAAYRRGYPRLVTLAWRVLGDHGEAEDIAQETLARLADAAVLDRPDDEVDAWLRRVCLRRSFNASRNRRRQSDRVDRATRLDTPLTADTTGPVTAVLRAEEAQEVRAALEKLPDRQRACLLLRHSGYAYAEIAATLGIAVGSVGVLLARSERAFRRSYSPTNSKDLS